MRDSPYTSSDDAYCSTLSRLSEEFWGGYGDNRPDILYNEDRCETDKRSGPKKDPLEINGVRMSQVAMDQLRRLGLPLEWYTADELEDAVVACETDATLIDDPNGTTYEDKLHLDADELDGDEELPALFGFDADEYEKVMSSLRPKIRIKGKSGKAVIGGIYIPECELAEIRNGLREVSPGTDIQPDDHICSGLVSAPYREREQEAALAA